MTVEGIWVFSDNLVNQSRYERDPFNPMIGIDFDGSADLAGFDDFLATQFAPKNPTLSQLILDDS